ncbi:hypothetical protein [Sulfuritalea sp.]|uniref:hypothetical protein n=1 Tax=Sulfuritalea sp. TaxID=2480090 RepID=UPI001ACDC0EB|nr:hypothetical protein [Sulfuritalea sp.]MBN8474596.1 hypothetical protein [Sulfuritalea sp.]
MRTPPKTPKLLPWLAKKAGISDARAATLWHDAERWAARQATHGSATYFKLAVDRLMELVAAESLRQDAASFGWRRWARTQARFWAVSMQAMHEASALSARGWRLFGSAPRQRQQVPG